VEPLVLKKSKDGSSTEDDDINQEDDCIIDGIGQLFC